MTKIWRQWSVAIAVAIAAHPAMAEPIQSPSCDFRGPSCEANPTCKQPCNCEACRQPCPPCAPQQPTTPALPYQAQEVGSYVAPPRTGVARGATNNVGVEGGTITFPEVRLRFPSVQLPSFFRGRTNARMLLDAAEAPWQSQGFANAHAAQNEQVLTQQVLALRQQLAQAAPASGQSEAAAQAAREAAEQFAEANRQELEELRCEVRRLRDLERSIHEYQQRAAQNPGCKYHGPPPTPPADSRFRMPAPPHMQPRGEALQPETAQYPPVPGEAVPLQPPPVGYPESTGGYPVSSNGASRLPTPGYMQAQAVRYEQPAPQPNVIRQPTLAPVAARPILQPIVPQGRIIGARSSYASPNDAR